MASNEKKEKKEEKKVTRSTSLNKTDSPSECIFTKEEVDQLISEAIKKVTTMFNDKLLKMNAKIKQLEAKQKESDEKMKAEEFGSSVKLEKLEKAMNTMSSLIENLEINERSLQTRCKELHKRANALEQCSRRSHIRIHGLHLPNDLSCKDAVVKFVNEQLKIENIQKQRFILKATDIEVAHTLPKKSSAPPTQARCIIVRFFDREVRDAVIRARRQLSGKSIAISDDLTKENQKLIMDLKATGKFSNVWSWQGAVYALSMDSTHAKRYGLYDKIPASSPPVSPANDAAHS